MINKFKNGLLACGLLTCLLTWGCGEVAPQARAESVKPATTADKSVTTKVNPCGSGDIPVVSASSLKEVNKVHFEFCGA